MITNFFVISPRGDTVIAKSYRSKSGVGAHERSHTEAFFRKVKFWDGVAPGTPGMDTTLGLGSGGNKLSADSLGGGSGEGSEAKESKKFGDAPPVFVMPDGYSYMHVKRNGLIFGCATEKNISPVVVIELLSKIAKVFKDYCGTLSEESIRKNFILLYELLDELLDYGYPQVTQTENLKAFVYNEPIVVSAIANTGKMINPKTASASAVHKPVISSVDADGKKTSLAVNQKNEIFVDILERLSVLFSSNGYVLNSTIDGCIQMKSYLAGNPQLRLALNEDLIVGKNSGSTSYSSGVTVDDINFNDCVNLSEWDHGRTLSFYPPDGEFIVLSYRMTGEFKTPFRIFPSIEEVEANKLEIAVHIRAEIPDNHFGANVAIEVPLPHSTTAATCSVVSTPGATGVNAEYVSQDKKLVWNLKKFPGCTEQTMRAKITLNGPCTSQIRREIGPINMSYEIPMYNVSSLQVRYLRIAENMPGYTPYRW
eukprot:CAMPEP_0201694970 /NCGR_PEP_ID=MMETSP0578-20130828/7069_1 /ASSEMBLY_ACC=CAM_ASM_000663 /TAXON_ID=267565 /ORGANISM="Skeletonema grethea, Strain CCMP 1804" /LENGTH=480 /DNA_ID=CAMNT_0048180735 /DNA_START=47 /DNA_END=1486 /DNA_ORIENTATION=-